MGPMLSQTEGIRGPNHESLSRGPFFAHFREHVVLVSSIPFSLLSGSFFYCRLHFLLPLPLPLLALLLALLFLFGLRSHFRLRLLAHNLPASPQLEHSLCQHSPCHCFFLELHERETELFVLPLHQQHFSHFRLEFSLEKPLKLRFANIRVQLFNENFPFVLLGRFVLVRLAGVHCLVAVHFSAVDDMLLRQHCFEHCLVFESHEAEASGTFLLFPDDLDRCDCPERGEVVPQRV